MNVFNMETAKTLLKGVPVDPKEWERVSNEIFEKNKSLFAKLAKL